MTAPEDDQGADVADGEPGGGLSISRTRSRRTRTHSAM